MNIYKSDSFLSRLIGMTYSNYSNEYGISNIYNDHMPLSIILWFFPVIFSLFYKYWYFGWRLEVLRVIKVPCLTNISKQFLMFSLEFFRSWFCTSVGILTCFFYLILIGTTTPCDVIFQFVNPSVNKSYIKTNRNNGV